MNRHLVGTRPSQVRPGGFTLIEVLVVVAIIALLVAILLPALSEARNQAQAASCMARMRQGVNGALLFMTEQRMKKERWSTNYGWAVRSMRMNKGETEIFTCPSDPRPLPIAAALDRQYNGGMSKANYMGETGSDGIFNKVCHKGGNVYNLDIEDQLQDNAFGGDAYSDSTGDANIEITVNARGQKFAPANGSKPSAAWTHDMRTYEGKQLGVDGFSNKTVPVLWMSYGANASAGLRGAKGMPILTIEAGKLGVFAETMLNYPADNLPRAVRLRHGPRNTRKGFAGGNYMPTTGGTFTMPNNTGELGGNVDASYQPRENLNASFLDGHVERLHWSRMFWVNSANPNNYAEVKQSIWFGTRRTPEFTFGPPE